MPQIIDNVYCKKQKDCKLFQIIKPCPYLQHIPDNPRIRNTSERGVVHLIHKGAYCKFVIENFSGEFLTPVNFSELCIYNNLKDGEVISYRYENVLDCCEAIHTISSHKSYKSHDQSRQIKLLTVNKLWKRLIRQAIGIVRVAPESITNGQIYYQIVDTRNNIQVVLIPTHTIGVTDDFRFMNNLVGSTVQITYVDNGEETMIRCGIPIVILTFEKV